MFQAPRIVKDPNLLIQILQTLSIQQTEIGKTALVISNKLEEVMSNDKMTEEEQKNKIDEIVVSYIPKLYGVTDEAIQTQITMKIFYGLNLSIESAREYTTNLNYSLSKCLPQDVLWQLNQVLPTVFSGNNMQEQINKPGFFNNFFSIVNANLGITPMPQEKQEEGMELVAKNPEVED